MKLTKEHRNYMQRAAYALVKNLRLFYNRKEEKYRVYLKKFDDKTPEGFKEIQEEDENFAKHLLEAFVYGDTEYYLTNEERIIRYVFFNLLNEASSSFEVEIESREGTVCKGYTTGKIRVSNSVSVVANAQFELSVPEEMEIREIKLFQRMIIFVETAKDSWRNLKLKVLETKDIDIKDEKTFERFYEIDEYVVAGISQVSVFAAKTVLGIEAGHFDLSFKQLTQQMRDKLEIETENKESFGERNSIFKEL